MAKIIKRKPSKICKCCGKRFFKTPKIHPLQWEGRIYCRIICSNNKFLGIEYDNNKLNILKSRIIIKNNGCHEYTGTIDKKGYGEISFKNKVCRAHRIMYILTYGKIDKDINVLHKCDNRRCINPEHLFLGTKRDNTNDMKNKGRMKSGFDLPQTRLSINDKLKIKELVINGVKYETIANIFGIKKNYIRKLLKQMGCIIDKSIHNNKRSNYNEQNILARVFPEGFRCNSSPSIM